MLDEEGFPGVLIRTSARQPLTHQPPPTNETNSFHPPTIETNSFQALVENEVLGLTVYLAELRTIIH